MRKLFNILVFSLGIFLLVFSNTPAFADNKEYNIENAEFNVYLTEDGNANVTEKWDINFKNGDFTRFYLNRLNNTNQLEKYDNIQFDDFLINGKKCFKTNDLDNRPEGTYSIIDNKNNLEYAWYFRANNTKLSLENSYTLTNIVKCNEKGYAFFCYRFIGANFDKKIDNLQINIYPPNTCNMEVRNPSNMTYEINKDNVKLTTSDTSKLVKINIAMDKNVFSENIQTISQDVLDEITEEEESKNRVFFIISIIGFCMTIFIILIIFIKVISFIKNNKAAKNDTFVHEIINELKFDNITPFEFSRMCNIRRISINEFKLIFLDLLRKDILSIKNNNLTLNCILEDNLKTFEKKLITFLNTYGNQDTSSSKVISLDSLLNLLKDKTTLDNISLYDNNIIKKYKKKYKNKIKVLKIYFKNNSNNYTDDISEILNKYENQNFIEIENLYYMASKILTTTKREGEYFDNVRNNDYYTYYTPFYYMDYHSHQYIDNTDSSIGTGCSSCSSCSSCGGGGAD